MTRRISGRPPGDHLERPRLPGGGHARFYSPLHVAARLLRGRIMPFLIGVYAFALNRRWKREERGYLRGLEGVGGAAASRARNSGAAPTPAEIPTGAGHLRAELETTKQQLAARSEGPVAF